MSKSLFKKSKMSCLLSDICPAIANCRKHGIFTRLNTINCACRDLFKRLYGKGNDKNGK